jgi:hypothetical protein
MEKEIIIKEISREIKSRLAWRYFDRTCAWLIQWGTIISCISTFLLVVTKVDVCITAIVASISPVLIIIESTFKFSEREEHGRIYIAELQSIRHELENNKIQPYEAEKQRNEIRKKNPLKVSFERKNVV